MASDLRPSSFCAENSRQVVDIRSGSARISREGCLFFGGGRVYPARSSAAAHAADGALRRLYSFEARRVVSMSSSEGAVEGEGGRERGEEGWTERECQASRDVGLSGIKNLNRGNTILVSRHAQAALV